MALLAPDALPSSRALTELSTTFATGAKNMPMPTPLRTNGMMKAE